MNIQWRMSHGTAARDGLDQLENHLHSRVGGHVRNLRLTRRDNGLVLEGQARTYYAKQIAQQAIMEASGIPIIANEIHVH